MFDRFQIVLGHYLFACHYHNGQSSDLYLKLCRIGRYLTLSPLWQDDDLFDDENMIALEVYNNQERKHGFPLTTGPE